MWSSHVKSGEGGQISEPGRRVFIEKMMVDAATVLREKAGCLVSDDKTQRVPLFYYGHAPYRYGPLRCASYIHFTQFIFSILEAKHETCSSIVQHRA